jgi:hypothetical protein
MAGSFGYEKEKYDVSIKAGERILLPAVRKANKDTLIIANGFSCREQIEQVAAALHLAEVLQMALLEGSQGPHGNFPERKYVQAERPFSLMDIALATFIGALTAGAVMGFAKKFLLQSGADNANIAGN